MRVQDSGRRGGGGDAAEYLGLARLPLVGRLFGAENGVVRLSGDAVVSMVR